MDIENYKVVISDENGVFENIPPVWKSTICVSLYKGGMPVINMYDGEGNMVYPQSKADNLMIFTKIAQHINKDMSSPTQQNSVSIASPIQPSNTSAEKALALKHAGFSGKEVIELIKLEK